MLVARPPISHSSAEHGFTLIETLVAMVTGLLVTLAAFAFLQVSVNQTSRATSYVQASQIGRTAMTYLDDELNSACPSAGFAPVLKESTPELLIFRDAFSQKAEIAYGEMQKHEILWKKEGALATGTLTDARSVATGKESGSEEFTWSSPSKKRLASRIAKNGTEPIFRYYEYATETQAATTEASETVLKEIPLTSGAKLTSSQAENVAAVQVAFRALPADGKPEEKLGKSLALRSRVSFAFSAPVAEPKVTDEPCQ